jgi:hypothetical protein
VQAFGLSSTCDLNQTFHFKGLFAVLQGVPAT